MYYNYRMKLLAIVSIIIILLLGGISCVGSGLGATSDTTPLSISNIRVEDSSTTHADLAWTTNEPATTQMEYGNTTEYGMITPLDENLVTNHSVTLSGLEDWRLYHFRVRAKDGAGNEAISEDHNFTASHHPGTSM